jgi:hypothetical protein
MLARMTVFTAHKITIATATVFAGGPLVLYGALRFTRYGETSGLGIAIGGVVAAIVLGLYYRSFARQRREAE